MKPLAGFMLLLLTLPMAANYQEREKSGLRRVRVALHFLALRVLGAYACGNISSM